MTTDGTSSRDELLIDANPTKDFFIGMLTRDVPIPKAILDLIDNSVDGALRVASGGRYDGLNVRVELSAQKFRIADNCGGFSIKTAKEYAFRFGRPPGAPTTEHSIGQFGVGMKRTMFRLGKHFRVESTTKNEHFVVESSVPDWVRDPEWSFRFSAAEQGLDNLPETTGTIVEVTNLHPTVVEQFANETFPGALREGISEAHPTKLEQGLVITVNGIPANFRQSTLLSSDKIQPGYFSTTIPFEGREVRLRLWVGITDRSLHEGGWYIYCNGRRVVTAGQGPDSGFVTGRQYHPDFAFFRGYAFFDADNAPDLPWTTTKAGVDVDHPVYRSALLHMERLMLPVLEFLRKLARERDDNKEGDLETPLMAAVEGAGKVAHSSVSSAQPFVAPAPPARPTPSTEVNIQYRRSKKLVERVRQKLGLRTVGAVGEYTFDYYVEQEMDGE